MSLTNSIYNDQITYHSKTPRNYRAMPDADKIVKGHNPLCGDSFEFYIKTDDEGRIAEITFTGKGCAISTASASMMTKIAKGKCPNEIEAIFKEFQAMCTGKMNVDSEPNSLGNLTVFKSVSDFPVRVKCATLPWHTLNSSFNGDEKVSTE